MAKVVLGPAVVDIAGVRAGDRNEIAFKLKMGGAPLDLTGLTLSAQARKESTSEDPPALVAVISDLDPPAGTGVLRWDGEQVRALLNGQATWSGVWDMQADDGTPGGPLTVAAGSFGAVMDVTRTEAAP